MPGIWWHPPQGRLASAPRPTTALPPVIASAWIVWRRWSMALLTTTPALMTTARATSATPIQPPLRIGGLAMAAQLRGDERDRDQGVQQPARDPQQGPCELLVLGWRQAEGGQPQARIGRVPGALGERHERSERAGDHGG